MVWSPGLRFRHCRCLSGILVSFAFSGLACAGRLGRVVGVFRKLCDSALCWLVVACVSRSSLREGTSPLLGHRLVPFHRLLEDLWRALLAFLVLLVLALFLWSRAHSLYGVFF